MLAGLSASPSRAAGIAPEAAEGTVVVIGGQGVQTELTAEEIMHLPAARLIVSAPPSTGGQPVVFEGPLLWTLLDQAKTLNPGKPGQLLRQTITVTGHDGFTAVLAAAEIAPEFEGKQVVLADLMDGKALSPGHFHLIVPGDQRKGRSVRDVARITVIMQAPG